VHLDFTMNADYLCLELSMTPPARTPLRRPPPPSPSPSPSLIGMEKVIPPRTTPKRSPLSLEADTEKPLPPRPQRSRRSSSLYSGDNGYTKLIDLYTKWKVDDETDPPIAVQPIAYQEELADLLARRFTESYSPISPLAIPHYPKHTVSIPSLRLTSEDASATSVVDMEPAPSCVEFSRSLQAQKSEMGSSLDLSRSNCSSQYESVGMLAAERGPELAPSENGSSGEVSSTSSSDSGFVVYTGVRESVRAIVQSKRGRKKDSAPKGKERAESGASTKSQVQGSYSSQQPQRKLPWVSTRKLSFQEGVTGIRQSLALATPPSPSRQAPSFHRVGQKQLAIPLTPYQKYGAAVWHNSQRKQKRHDRAIRTPQTSVKQVAGTRKFPNQSRRMNHPQRASEVFNAFQHGKAHILSALDETKNRLARTYSEKRQETMKKVVMPSRPVEERETRHTLFRTHSEKRREKLKKSIALVGPVDPYAVGHFVRKDSEETGGEGGKVLNKRIKLVTCVEQEPAREMEYWL
jgi:hypothetical protein